MPTIDIYATAGNLPDTHHPAADLALALVQVEQVPNIPLVRKNTAAFVHELGNDALSNVDGARHGLDVVKTEDVLGEPASVEQPFPYDHGAKGQRGTTRRCWAGGRDGSRRAVVQAR